MANNVQKFENTNIPAYLRGAADEANNPDLGSSGGFPTISIKGKHFTIVEDGDHRIVNRADEPDVPAASIVGVIVNMSPIVKTYYKGAFTESASKEQQKPDCFSNDGVTPDTSVQTPVCHDCRLCKYNAFGTARLPNGGFGKGKACTDSVRLAVLTGGEDKVYLLRIPATSIKALREYRNALTRRGVPYDAVLTKISFDPMPAFPKLQFSWGGNFLTEEQFAKVKALSKDPMVLSIIGQKAPAQVQAPAKKVIQIAKDTVPQTAPEARSDVKSGQRADTSDLDAQVTGTFEENDEINW